MTIIRADGNSNIGIGHVMRCISIARALMQKGERVLFVTADNEVDYLLNDKGIDHYALGTEYDAFEDEIPSLVSVINDHQADVILVDSYFATNGYLEALGKLVKIVFLDDLCERAMPADVIINYNIQADKKEYIDLYQDENNKPKFLLGLDYVPLREEFYQTPCITSGVDTDVKSILLSTGGSDPKDISRLIAEEWMARQNDLAGICLNIVCGPLYKNGDELEKLVSKSTNIKIHHNVQNMVKLMDECQLAIASTGSTIYELCARRVPTISFYFVENQRRVAEAFEKKIGVSNAGDISVDSRNVLEVIFGELKSLITNKELRNELSEDMYRMVSGGGAINIASEIIEIKEK